MEKIIFRNSTNVKFQQLKNIIEKDKLRPQFTGVFLDLENLKIVGTNGKIMFAYDIEVIDDGNLEELIPEGLQDVVIDARIFNQSNWLNVPKEDLELVEFHVSFEKTEVYLGEEIVAISNNISHDVKFPNWKGLLKISEVGSKMGVDSRLMKQAFSALPNGFETPEIHFGNRILLDSKGSDFEDKEVEIVGLIMPLSFGEARIYEISQRFDIEIEKKHKIDLSHLIGRTLSKRVLKTWNEDFVDEDNGEVVSIERNEIILDRETVLDFDSISVLEVNNIKEIFVIKND